MDLCNCTSTLKHRLVTIVSIQNQDQVIWNPRSEHKTLDNYVYHRDLILFLNSSKTEVIFFQSPLTAGVRAATAAAAVLEVRSLFSEQNFQPCEEIQTRNWPSKRTSQQPRSLTRRRRCWWRKRRNDLSVRLTSWDTRGIRCWCQRRKTFLEFPALCSHILGRLAFCTSTVQTITTMLKRAILEILDVSLPATWLRKKWRWFWRQLKHWSILRRGSAQNQNPCTSTQPLASLRMKGALFHRSARVVGSGYFYQHSRITVWKVDNKLKSGVCPFKKIMY